MTFKQIIKQVGAGLLSVGSAFASAGLFETILGDILSNSMENLFFVNLLSLGLTSSVAVLAAKKVLQLRKNVKLLEKKNLEKEIVRLALINEGNVNVAETILELNVSIEKAKTALENLAKYGILEQGLGVQNKTSFHLADFVEPNQLREETQI